MRAGKNRALELLLHGFDFALEAPSVHEFEQRETAVVCEREHCAERGLEPLRIETFDVARAAGGGPDVAVEGDPETAAGFEAVIELKVEHGFSLAHAREGQAHAARAMIGVKGHAAVTLERAPGSRGFDAATGQIDVAQAARRLGLDRGEQLRHQRWRAAAPMQRLTSPARPVARVQRLARRGEKFDIFALRRAHATRGAAEDPRSRDADEENTLEARIVIDHRAVHHFGRRKLCHARIIGARACAASSIFGRQIPRVLLAREPRLT